jgi:hypothetical protein
MGNTARSSRTHRYRIVAAFPARRLPIVLCSCGLTDTCRPAPARPGMTRPEPFHSWRRLGSGIPSTYGPAVRRGRRGSPGGRDVLVGGVLAVRWRYRAAASWAAVRETGQPSGGVWYTHCMQNGHDSSNDAGELLRGVAAVAAFLGCSQKQVGTLASRRGLPLRRLGQGKVALRRELLEWIAAQLLSAGRGG